MATEEEARAIKSRHSPQLLRQPGVCGVGVEKDEAGNFVIAIHLDSDDPEVRAHLPQHLEGWGSHTKARGIERSARPR